MLCYIKFVNRLSNLLSIMKYKLLILPCFLLLTWLSGTALAQVGIGTTTPDAKALLHLKVTGTPLGLLLPQMSTATRTGAFQAGLNSSHTGMIVADTSSGTGGLYVWVGSAWMEVQFAGAGYLTRTGNHVYVTNLSDSVGIGVANPEAKLQVAGMIMANELRIFNLNDSDINNGTFSNVANQKAAYRFIRAQGTPLSPSAVQSNYNLGRVEWAGHEGSTYVSGSMIESKATANWTGAASHPTDLSFATSGAGDLFPVTRLYVSDKGNIGIGTSNPLHKLDIVGNINLTTIDSLLLGGSFGTPGQVLAVRAGGGMEWVTPSGGAGLWTANGSDIYYNAGNVGIGTTTPLALLHLHKEFATNNTIETGIQISRLTSGTAAVGIGTSVDFNIENGGGTGVAAARLIANLENIAPGSEVGQIAFSVMNGGTLTPRMFISGVGQVLMEANPASNSPNLSIGRATAVSGTEAASMAFRGNGIRHAGFSYVPNTTAGMSRLNISFGLNANPGNNTTLFSFHDNGNMGIGVSAVPAEKLEINGNLRFSSIAGSRSISISSPGTISQPGGTLNIQAGDAGTLTTGGSGGALGLKAGNAAGTGNNPGGSVTVQGGNGTVSGDGGGVSMVGGTAGLTGNGGSASIMGGSTISAINSGGGVTISGGNNTAAGNGGSVSIYGGSSVDVNKRGNVILAYNGTSWGRVGIGTLAPNKELEVTGNVRITGLATGVSGGVVTSGTTGDLNFTNFTGSTSDVLRGDGTFGTPSVAAISSLNTLTAPVQSFATGTSGTDPNFSSAGSTHTLNIPLASTAAVTSGTISNADYTSFANKPNGSGIAGRMPYWSNASTLATANNMVWDNTNNRLGLGTVTPQQPLHIIGTARITGVAAGVSGALVVSDVNGDLARVNYSGNATDVFLGSGTFGALPAGSGNYIQNQTAIPQVASFRINGNGLFNGGKVGIGTTTPGYPLEVINPTGSGNLYGMRVASTSDIGTNVEGILGSADGSGNANKYGVHGVAAGTGTSGWNVGIYGESFGVGTGDKTGVYGNATSTGSELKIGGYFEAAGNAAGGNKYGVYATSTGTGNSNYGLYAAAAGATNNYAAVFPTGNVGIGTSAPVRTLEVIGSVRVSNLASGGSNAIVTSNPSGDLNIINFNGSNTQALMGNGTFASVPLSADNGLTFIAPYVKLGGSLNANTDIASNGFSFTFRRGMPAIASFPVFLNDNGGVNSGMAMEFQSLRTDLSIGTMGRVGAVMVNNVPATYQGDLIFETNNLGSLGEKMRITGVGNVGIGTASPGGYKLNVNGNTFSSGGFETSASQAYKYTSAKTMYKWVSASKFAAAGGVVTVYSNDGTEVGPSGVGAALVAALELPHGAVISSVDARVLDNNAAAINNMQVYRSTGTTGVPLPTPEVIFSNATPTVNSVNVQSMADNLENVAGGATIDNQTYQYAVSVTFTGAAATTLKLKGVLVTYTVSATD